MSAPGRKPAATVAEVIGPRMDPEKIKREAVFVNEGQWLTIKWRNYRRSAKAPEDTRYETVLLQQECVLNDVIAAAQEELDALLRYTS